MEIHYIVHSCVEQTFEVVAQLNGVDVKATVLGLVAELVSKDGTMNRTVRFKPQDVAAAKALYVVGATIITVDTAAPAAPAA